MSTRYPKEDEFAPKGGDRPSRRAELEARTADRLGYQAAFRESEDRWRKLLDFSRDGIYVQVDGRFVLVNAAMTALLGEKDTLDLIGRRVLEVIHPDDREAADRRINRVMESAKIASCSNQRYVMLNGTTILTSVSEAPVMYGARKAVQVIVTDLSARERAEEAARISRESFKALVSTINEGFAVIDDRGMIKQANYRFRQIVSFSIEELDGRSLQDLLDPSGRDSFAKLFLSARTRRKRVESEVLLHAKDGLEVPALLSLSCVYDSQDRFARAYTAITDITELKRVQSTLGNARKELERVGSYATRGIDGVRGKAGSAKGKTVPRDLPAGSAEERFRAVFSKTGDCVYIKDSSLTFTHVNSALEDLFGLSESQLIGKGAESLHESRAAEQIREIEKRVLLGESLEGEFTRNVKSVPTRFYEIRIPLRDDSGTVVGLCGILRDLTERRRQTPSSNEPGFDYPSGAMRAVLEKARQAAATDSVVLLQGESGSGKDFLARFIHSRSARKKGPFFEINCAALTHDLAESELFGHESGAFTGAHSRKKGLVELAEGGTLLLNEIGELAIFMQAKLLTFLDSKTFMRVGGEKPRFVNTRIIAATHRDMEEEVGEGRFLKALYYRLNVFSIRMPALRDRIEDLPLLVEELTAKLAGEMNWPQTPKIDGDRLETLAGHSWPGNVRELRNVLERTLIMWNSGQWDADFFSDSGDIRAKGDPGNRSADLNVQRRKGELTQSLCQEALKRAGGNKTLAAEMLGISRISFYRYLKAGHSGPDNVTEP